MSQALLQVAAAGIGALLFAAALGKLNSWSRWKVTTTQLFPTHLRAGRLLRNALPILEISVGAITFIRPALGLACAAALLLAFAVGAFWLTPDQGGAECGCFGALMPSRIGRGLALRNAALAVAAALVGAGAVRLDLPAFRPAQMLLIIVIGLNVVVIAEFRRMPRQTLRGASEMRPT